VLAQEHILAEPGEDDEDDVAENTIETAGSRNSVDVADSDLLRDEMVEARIRARPRTKDDWLRKINLDLRLNTDGPQFMAYVDRVLALTGQLKN